LVTTQYELVSAEGMHFLLKFSWFFYSTLSPWFSFYVHACLFC